MDVISNEPSPPRTALHNAHTQTQDSVHVTKAGSDRQWNWRRGAKTGFQADTGGVTIQVWEDKFYLITRAVRAGSMTRLHFLTWTTLIVRRANSVKLGLSAKHYYSWFLIWTVTFCRTQSHRKRNGHKNIPRHLQKLTQKKTSQAASVCDFFSYW